MFFVGCTSAAEALASQSAAAAVVADIDASAPTKAFLQNCFPGKTLQYSYVPELFYGARMVVDVVEDDISVAQRYSCTIKTAEGGAFSVETTPLFKFKVGSINYVDDFFLFERPEGGFRITVSDDDLRPFHPAIVDWEDAYITHMYKILIAKADGRYWFWQQNTGWEQKPLGWEPIKNDEDIRKRVMAALPQDPVPTNIELLQLEFNPFIFSTAIKFKGGIGLERLMWATQQPDRAVVLRPLGDALSGTVSSWGGLIYWCDSLGKYHLQRIDGSALNRSIAPIYPGVYLDEWIEFSSKGDIFELKAKKPDSDNLECWLYNVALKTWTSLPDAEPEPSFGEHKKRIQIQYPGFEVNIRPYTSRKFLGSLVDPRNVTQERLVVLTKKAGASTYDEQELLVAMADSITVSHMLAQYKGLDAKLHVKKLKFLDEVVSLEDALPPYPPSITSWEKIVFSEDGKLLFAQYVTNYGRDTEYWTLKDGIWKLLYRGGALEQSLVNVDGKNVYKVSHSAAGLTLEFLNLDTLQFEPTNILNVPVSVIEGDFFEEPFIVSKKDPHFIIAVADYRDGISGWTFLDGSSSSEGEGATAASVVLDSPIPLATQYIMLLDRVRQKWKTESRPYADVPLSVRHINLDGYGQLSELHFYFYQNKAFGRARLLGEELSVEWDKSIDDAASLHPPLQPQHVNVGGHNVPYYYVPSVGAANGKTIVLMEGGPRSYYTGSFAEIIDHYTKNGWSVIIPQESLRTGYGWQHFARGIGEMGRRNLHQLLHIFHDAIGKSLIPDINQVSLYGHSYGGFVATSFALRWPELHVEAGLEKKFDLQSIVADAAMVDFGLLNLDSSRLLLHDSVLADQDAYMHRVMPIHRVGEPLSAPLFLVHGRVDVRCSAAHMQEFIGGLKAAGNVVPLFWHAGGHNPPNHEHYPNFLMALMGETDTAALEGEIGLTRE